MTAREGLIVPQSVAGRVRPRWSLAVVGAMLLTACFSDDGNGNNVTASEACRQSTQLTLSLQQARSLVASRGGQIESLVDQYLERQRSVRVGRTVAEPGGHPPDRSNESRALGRSVAETLGFQSDQLCGLTPENILSTANLLRAVREKFEALGFYRSVDPPVQLSEFMRGFRDHLFVGDSVQTASVSEVSSRIQRYIVRGDISEEELSALIRGTAPPPE